MPWPRATRLKLCIASSHAAGGSSPIAPALASICARIAAVRSSTPCFHASKMPSYLGPWHDMHDTRVARVDGAPRDRATATFTVESSGLWQPWQVTPARNIGLGMRGTPRPPVPA